MKTREQVISFGGVILLALLLPAILRLTNSVVRYIVGAEGRLAAISVESDHVLGPLSKPWKAVAQGGDNLAGFLDQDGKALTDLNLDYIRIDHIYDEFGVVKRENGKLTYDWSRLDRVVNQIIQTGAKPFLALSYMPPVISSRGILDEPRDWNEWTEVVQRTIEHYSGEMGLVGMYYEVWNEPDLFGKWNMGGKKDYKKLYAAAAHGAELAQGVKPFKFGGPGITGLYRNWIDNFFPFILQNKLRLDFFSWHRYDLDLGRYTADINNVELWLERHPYFSQTEKIITEMAPQSDPGGVNDTPAGAAQVIAVAREMLYRVKYGFTFAASGKWGIVGKPRYEAFQMLNLLGEERLGITGEGTWVKAIGSKKGNIYQTLLVNYDPAGKHTEAVPVTFLNIAPGSYSLKAIKMGGGVLTDDVATDEAMLQRDIPLPANSAVLVELEPKPSPIPTFNPL